LRIARTGKAEPCIRRSEIWKISRSASSSSFSTSWRAVEALGDDLAADPDEVAQQGLLADDAPVSEEVGGGGRLLHQHGEGGGTAHRLQIVLALELLGQRDEIDGLVALEEHEHGVEDLPVPLLVEVGGAEDLDRLGQALALEQNGAE
jgi:hypothetical protein